MEETRTREEILAEINGYEQLLKAQDYIGVKIAEGRATVADYAEEIAQADEWAAKIRELREELEEMDAAE